SPLNRDEAARLLDDWVTSPSLRRHCQAVEAVMRAAATRYGGVPSETDRWGLAGLLHDADYEPHPEEHPRVIVAWLHDRGEHEIAQAVAAHSIHWEVPSRSPMALALLACDELTGFVVACALPRPDGIHTLTSNSVLAKLKKPSFASKVDRGEIIAGANLLGTDLSSHIEFVIETLRSRADNLQLSGSTPR